MNESEKEERKIWYQLLENNPLGTKPETGKAFEAFEVFLKLGTDRSIVKACDVLDKSIGTLQRWVSEYEWQKRAESYDQWKHDLAIKSHEETLQAEADIHQQDWISKRSNLRKEEYETGMKMISIGNKILAMIFDNPLNPVVIRKNVKNRYDFQDGKKKTEKNKVLTGYDETTAIGNNLELIDRAVKSIEAGFKLCRNSIDLPVGSFNHTFGNLPTSVEDLMALSDEERNSKLNDLNNAEEFYVNLLKSRGEDVDEMMVSMADN